MRKTLRWSTTAVLVAGLAGVTALAQQPQRGGGGFGGGFGLGGPSSLIRSKTVRTELKVTDDQGTKLDAWSKEYATKSREMFAEKFKGLQDLPQEERGKKMAEINAEITKDVYKQLGEVLKEDQIKRLQQIDVQVAGPQAFVRKDVQDAVKFNDEQKDKVRQISTAAQKERRELAQEYGIGGRPGGAPPDQAKMAEYQKKATALDEETMTKISAVLTDDQKKAWKDLTGEKVDVAKIQQESRPQFTRKKDD